MDRERDAARAHASRRRPTILAGRAPEQIFLREELAAAASGHGRLILLGGEAGIGKTTLAQDLVCEARARGRLILTGHCYDHTNAPPYGPWLDLCTDYPDDPVLPAPPAAFAAGVLKRVVDQAALFADVRRFFADLAALGPVLLLLEDLHWADPASLELLRHVVRHLGRWPILVVGTYRVDEPARHHPFYRQFPALVREADGIRLDLRRLDTKALRALVAAHYALPPQDEASLTAYLDRHADGNPFFATEILRTMEEEGILGNGNDGGWTLGELDRAVVPALLRQVIDGRVTRLGDAVRLPLAVAAVIGQEIPLALWAEVAGLDEAALLTIVEQAVDAHLLAAEGDGARVRFVHALTRDALYEGVLPPRRRVLHRQVAEAVMAGARPDVDMVAYHLQWAGDPRAGKWLEMAGDRAQRAYAWLTAIARFDAAAALLAETDGAERTRGRLLYRVSRLQRFADPEGALVAVDAAEELAARIDDPILAAEVRFHRGILHCYLDRFAAGVAELGEGIAALEAMPLDVTRAFTVTEPWLADSLPATDELDAAADDIAVALLHAAGLHYRRGVYPWFLATAGRLREAIAVGERFLAALAGAPPTKRGIRSVAAFTHLGLGIAYGALGRADDARQAFAWARELFAGVDHHSLIAFTLLAELRDVALSYGAADPAARRRIAAEAEAALGRARGALRSDTSPHLARLGALVVDGAWNEAIGILGGLPTPPNAYLRREATCASSELARHRGQPETAWEEIRARFSLGPATAPGDHILQEGLLLQRLAAHLCLDVGDLDGARAWLAAHDDWLAWSGSVLGRADGRLAWARYHDLSGDAERARHDAAAALELASDPDQPLTRLAAHRLLGDMAVAAGATGIAEPHLTASLELADACEAPFERVLTLLPLAQLRAAEGERDAALALLDEADRLCAALGAAPALARADHLRACLRANEPEAAFPAGLTRREVEVIRLVAQRQTDKEIAEALFLGPRTVQSHVAHVLGKLNVSNRREAAAAAERLGLL